jgi:hypothetical protein
MAAGAGLQFGNSLLLKFSTSMLCTLGDLDSGHRAVLACRKIAAPCNRLQHHRQMRPVPAGRLDNACEIGSFSTGSLHPGQPTGNPHTAPHLHVQADPTPRPALTVTSEPAQTSACRDTGVCSNRVSLTGCQGASTSSCATKLHKRKEQRHESTHPHLAQSGLARTYPSDSNKVKAACMRSAPVSRPPTRCIRQVVE